MNGQPKDTTARRGTQDRLRLAACRGAVGREEVGDDQVPKAMRQSEDQAKRMGLYRAHCQAPLTTETSTPWDSRAPGVVEPL